MPRLTEEMLQVLEELEFEVYLCTATRSAKPSGRMVGVLPSDDLTKLYVGNGRLNKAERDLSKNTNAMFVFYNARDDPYEIRGFQLECELVDTIEDKDAAIFQSVYEVTKQAVNEEEAKGIKWVYVFEIKQAYDCSLEGGGQPLEA